VVKKVFLIILFVLVLISGTSFAGMSLNAYIAMQGKGAVFELADYPAVFAPIVSLRVPS
jgi:hypothetical protein